MHVTLFTNEIDVILEARVIGQFSSRRWSYLQFLQNYILTLNSLFSWFPSRQIQETNMPMPMPKTKAAPSIEICRH